MNLPAAEVPVASRLRATADNWTPRLELVAVACLIGALVFGNRPRVVRWAGMWSVGAGASWMAAPAVVTWAADAWVPGQSAIVQALFKGVGGSVNSAATDLIVGGALTIVASATVSILMHHKSRRPARATTAVADTHQYPDAAGRFGYKGRPEMADTKVTAGHH